MAPDQATAVEELFAAGPRRDSRFRVAENWEALENSPSTTQQEIVEFLHRQMNEEINGLEISCRNLSDFPDAPWELRMSMARQCWDEARHIDIFRRVYEARGGRVGDYPVINFQYRILMKIDSLLGRLAVQNRSFEAAGIDAIQDGLATAKENGDDDLVELFDTQIADEIQHVRFANDWIKRLTAGGDPAEMFRMVKAISQATRAFAIVAGEAITTYDVAGDLRREAGFSEDEIDAVRQRVSAVMSGSQ